jgi:beta-aspartyl-peptidase (threonine type)
MSMRMANSFFLSMLFLAGCSAAEHAQPAAPRTTKWAIAIHGGGGEEEWQHMDAATAAAYHASLARALDAGTAVLSKGGRSIDAVETAIKVLEDDPLFNAGRGAAFDSLGRTEMDAAIMDGATLEAGSVAEVSAT